MSSMKKIIDAIKEARRNNHYEGRNMSAKPNKDAVLKDVAFKLSVMLPVSEDEAFELVREIKSYVQQGHSVSDLLDYIRLFTESQCRDKKEQN